jgi:PAS domain S-box-containing protein
MARLGRVVIDDGGMIVHADQNFLATVRLEPAHLLGRNLLDFTAPADQERCIFLLAKLVRDGEAVSTVKRLVRDDGTHVWINNRLSLATPENEALRIAIDVTSAAVPSGWVDPADLLHVAQLLFEGLRARAAIFPPSLFGDHAWDILLAAYVCEAEGGQIATVDLPDMIGIGVPNASRWLRALHAEGLLEFEKGDSASAPTASFRLSAGAHQKLEIYLTERYRYSIEPERDMAAED